MRSPCVVERILASSRLDRSIIWMSPDGTYRAVKRSDLFKGARICASNLKRAGVLPNKVVAIMMSQGVELIQVWLGALILGAIPTILCPPNSRQSTAQWAANLLHIIEHSGAGSLILNSTVVEQTRDVDGTDRLSGMIIVSDTLFSGDSELSPFIRSYDSPILLQHSSGTTGLHKGVALTDAALITQTELYANSLALDPAEDKIVSWLPLYHDMGLIACLVLPLLTNTEFVFMDNFEWVKQPIMLLRAITNWNATICWMPNFAFNFLASRISPSTQKSIDLKSMRLWINCSETVRTTSFSRFLDVFNHFGVTEFSLASCYAMAENTFAVTQTSPGSPPRKLNLADMRITNSDASWEFAAARFDIASSGKPLVDHQIEIRDSHGTILPANTIGEIFIKSTCLMKEYYNRPDLTEAAFDVEWYSSGDLGLLCAGELYVCGRKKDLIIHAGKNIFPEDIERCVNESPGVYKGRCVAFGVFEAQEGTENIIVLAEHADPEAASTSGKIVREIKRRVYNVTSLNVKEVHLLPHHTLLKSSSGKISRERCRQLYLDKLTNSNFS